MRDYLPALPFPAYAGVILFRASLGWAHLAFPRIRGGDPVAAGRRRLAAYLSPHTRG